MKSLPDLRVQPPALTGSRLLKLLLDPEEQREREEVREGVGEEGQRATEAEEDAPDRVPDDVRRVLARVVRGDCVRELAGRNDATKRARLRDAEEDVEGALEEGDDDYVGE